VRNFRLVDEIRIRLQADQRLCYPMTIDGCGISSHQFELLKKFRESLKFGQTLFVVSVLVRYYQINELVNISHLQSPDARFFG